MDLAVSTARLIHVQAFREGPASQTCFLDSAEVMQSWLMIRLLSYSEIASKNLLKSSPGCSLIAIPIYDGAGAFHPSEALLHKMKGFGSLEDWARRATLISAAAAGRTSILEMFNITLPCE